MHLCAVVLAAGLGVRLRPLTDLLPKALCPVANEPLLDGALRRVRTVTPDAAVNVHAHASAMSDHLPRHHPDVHVSVEHPDLLGTAGALGRLKPWIDGRAVLVHNADAWHRADIAGVLVEGWDGVHIRLLCVERPPAADFGRWLYAGVALLPWWAVEPLAPEPSGLYETSWREAYDAGRVELVPYAGAWFDCGTPRSYLDANLCASGGETVVGEGAVVEGEAVRSVVWPGARVERGERLVEAIRAPGGVTVQA